MIEPWGLEAIEQARGIFGSIAPPDGAN